MRGGYVPTSFAAHLQRVAAVAPDDVAVIQGASRLTWAVLDSRASKLAGYLADRGLAAGSRVAIAATNCPEYLIALLAAFKIGACVANVNYRYRRAEMAYVLADSGAQAVIFAGDLADEVLAAVAQTGMDRVLISIGARGDSVAAIGPVTAFDEVVATHPPLAEAPEFTDNEWLLYTGGTTGKPKAVVGLERERLAVLRGIALSNMGLTDAGATPEQVAAHAAGIEPRPVYFTPAPLMHGTGLYCALTALVGGSPIVLSETPAFDAEGILNTLAAHRVTDMYVVGDAMMLPIVEALDTAARAGHHHDLGSLRRIQSTGAVWSRSVKERMLAHADVTQLDMIAATEGGPFAIAESSRSRPPTDPAAFVLAPNARLLDPSGSELPSTSSQIGLLAVATTPNARYLGDDQKTAETFRDIGGVRYAVPGDLASFDPDGTLRLLGRASSVINSGGEKIYADEVESVIRTHPDILDAVVAPVPDERFGQLVGAVVTVRGGAQIDADGLGGHVAAILSDFKKPRVVCVVPEIRRLASAKADLAWARDLLATRGGHRKDPT